MQTVLSICYLPPISWFRALLNCDSVLLDRHEHFVKQTYRSRCQILSANGRLSLSVPVKKGSERQSMSTALIDNESKWQKQHWEALRSAYGSSAFFEHYEHRFRKIFEQQYELLMPLNLDLILLCLELMGLENELNFSEKYLRPNECLDLRELISPKKPPFTNTKPYFQVFSSKFAFENDLSIADLVFNVGPGSTDYLK